MSVFGPVDNKDRLAWQVVAAAALVEVLDLGFKRDLPVVWWSVNGPGGLQGKVPAGYGRADEREVWRAWVDVLDLVVGESWTGSGVEHVKATARYRTKRGALTTITLRAEIPRPEAEMAEAAELGRAGLRLGDELAREFQESA